MGKIRDHQEMEKRRLRSPRLFEKGYSSAEVARRLGVARQVSHRWKQAWEVGGKAALASKGQAGRKSKMEGVAVQRVVEALLSGPKSQGYKTQLWTLPRVSVLIHKITGVRYHPGHVWRVLGALGFSCQRPERRALERDEKAIGTWKRSTWPALKKSPPPAPPHRLRGRKRIEHQPTRVRTWAPRGQTPLLHESFNWKSLSIIGGITLRRFHFQMHPGSIKGPQVVEFIKHLHRHLKARLLIIWDGAAIHRSKLVSEFLATTNGQIIAERLPPYAPELNPAEYMWAHLKCHEIANLITTQAWELSFEATQALRRMRRRPSIIAACFRQAELWP